MIRTRSSSITITRRWRDCAPGRRSSRCCASSRSGSCRASATGYLTTEARSGKRIEADEYYHFQAGQGLTPARAGAGSALAGRSLLDLAGESLTGARALDDARRVLQAALAACLEGRPLATRGGARTVAKSMMRKAAR